MASDGFLDAPTKAVHDDENKPTIVSISWGGPEDPSAQGFQQQFDQGGTSIGKGAGAGGGEKGGVAMAVG